MVPGVRMSTIGTGGIPTNNWMRDDCLGGTEQVAPVFDDLYKRSAFDLALAEKDNATAIWTEIVASTSSLQAAIPDTADGGLCMIPFLSFSLHTCLARCGSGVLLMKMLRVQGGPLKCNHSNLSACGVSCSSSIMASARGDWSNIRTAIIADNCEWLAFNVTWLHTQDTSKDNDQSHRFGRGSLGM
eukprot:COSAG02_NODE_7328_length_3061_cov_5.107698_2_plen_186_part_00